MSKIVLISCASKKMPHKAKAEELYTSQLFRKSLEYARQLSPEKVFVLSAKYGLITLDDNIEPYDITLNSMPTTKRRQWATKVITKLRECCDLENDQFVILAGKKYREYLLPHLKSYEVPLAGLTIGKQLQWLKARIKDK